MKLEIPDHRAGELKLSHPFDFRGQVGLALAKLGEGPLMFGAEAEDARPTDSLLWMDLDLLKGGPKSKIVGEDGRVSDFDQGLMVEGPSPRLDPKIVGRAGTLSEVDFIALSRQLPAKGTTECSYSGPNADGNITGESKTMALRESEVTVYARRTGAVVATKVFAPRSQCPATINAGFGGEVWNSPRPNDAIETWLGTRVRR